MWWLSADFTRGIGKFVVFRQAVRSFLEGIDLCKSTFESAQSEVSFGIQFRWMVEAKVLEKSNKRHDADFVGNETIELEKSGMADFSLSGKEMLANH